MNRRLPSIPSRWTRRTLIALAIVVVLVAAAWASLRAFLPPDRVKALLSARLSAALKRDLRVGRASVTLFPPVRVRIGDVALAQPEGFARGPMLELDGLDLDLDAFALLARKLEVRRLVLRQPRIYWITQPDGRSSIDDLLRPQPARRGTALTMDLRELRVVDGRVVMDDLRSGKRATFHWDQQLRLRVGRKRIASEGDARIWGYAFGPTTVVNFDRLDAGLADLELKLRHRGHFDRGTRKLTLERGELALGKATLSVAGTVDSLGREARAALHVTGRRIDLGALLGALSKADVAVLRGVRGDGEMDMDLRLTGPVSWKRLPAMTGAGRIRHGSLRYPGAPAEITDLETALRFHPDQVEMIDLRARAGGQPLRVQGRIYRFADPLLDAVIRGTLDLGAVGPLLAGKEARMAGRAGVDARASGRLRDPGAMALSGSLWVREAQVESKRLPRRLEHLNGTFSLSGTRARVSGLSFAAGKSSLQFDATVDRPLALLAQPGPGQAAGASPIAPAQVDFSLRSPNLDLADLAPSGGGPMPVFRARGAGTVAIGRFKNGKLEARDVRADLSLAPDLVEVTRYSLKAYGGGASGTARFESRAPARPAYRVTAQVESMQADALLSAWTPAHELLSGVLSGNAELRGEGTRPAQIRGTLTGDGAARVAAGRLAAAQPLEELARITGLPELRETSFRDLQASFHVEHGRVVTDPVTIFRPSGDWRMAGAIGFDGSLDYAVSITLPAEVASRLPHTAAAIAAGALRDPEGRLLLDLRITGTVSSPKVRWDPRAMRARLTGKVTDVLAEQRKRLEQEAQTTLLHAITGDSSRHPLENAGRAMRDSLKKLGENLFKGLIPGKTQEPAKSVPADTAKRDTTP